MEKEKRNSFLFALMTVLKLDFTRPDHRSAETPKGLASLGKYKPKGKDDAIVIDAGSWQYRAGYASHNLPACTIVIKMG